MAWWSRFDAFSPACVLTAQEPIWSSMVSNNAAEFSSGFGLRVNSVLGSDECAPRIARSISSGARSALISHLAKQGQGKSKEARLTLGCYAPQSLAEACNMVLPQAMHKTRHCASHLGHPRSIALIWFSQQADSTRGGAGYRRSHTSGQRRISTPLPRRCLKGTTTFCDDVHDALKWLSEATG